MITSIEDCEIVDEGTTVFSDIEVIVKLCVLRGKVSDLKWRRCGVVLNGVSVATRLLKDWKMWFRGNLILEKGFDTVVSSEGYSEDEVHGTAMLSLPCPSRSIKVPWRHLYFHSSTSLTDRLLV